MLVREASPGSADAARVRSVLEACGLSAAGVVVTGSRYWLAEAVEGNAVGTVGLERCAGAALLRSAAVLPAWRARGIGEKLVSSALDAARDAGCRAVYLFSTGAGAYWTRLGFAEVPVPELVAALPGAPQVLRYTEMGTLDREIAWRKALE